MSCHHEHSLQSSEAGARLRAAMPMLYEAASAGRASASRWARGATSFVPSVGVISVLEESTLSIRLSTACTSESSSRSP